MPTLEKREHNIKHFLSTIQSSGWSCAFHTFTFITLLELEC